MATDDSSILGLPLPALDAQQRTKTPGAAIFFSILVPGAGQLFRGDVGRGLAFLIVCAVYYVVAYLLANSDWTVQRNLSTVFGLLAIAVHVCSIFEPMKSPPAEPTV